MRKGFNQRSFYAEQTIRVIFMRWEEFCLPGANVGLGRLGMTLRGQEYQSSAFEYFCIRRREFMKSFEQGSGTVRAGHGDAESGPVV